VFVFKRPEGTCPRERARAFGASRCDLAEQDAAQRLEPRRRVVEGEQNRLRLVRLEGKRDDAPLVGVAESTGELFVLQQAGELEHEAIGDGHACKEHTFDYDRFGDAA
jgi:hypothetical protein